MNSKLLYCGLALACSLEMFPQSVELTTRTADVLRKGDSLVCKLDLNLALHDINSRYLIKLTPVVKNGSDAFEFPEIQVVGEKKKNSFLRRMAFAKRGGKSVDNSFVMFFSGDNTNLPVNYSKSVAFTSWMSGAGLEIKKEVYNEKGALIQNVSMKVPASSSSSSVAAMPAPLLQSSIGVMANDNLLASSGDEVRSTETKRELKYRGTYCTPPIDEADKISKKEIDFSLEEARVMADVNPQILSLSELYTVALSYKNEMEQFYKIIFLSVRLYPANPIANLNAAAASIEMNMVDKVGQFLQLAPHDTVAYKNCRGVYELMVGNISEGMRMLKEAKANGSEEANQNLAAFFKYHKR